MASKQIYWGDGTSDVITLTYSGNVGSTQMSVASSPNNFLSQRSKTVALKSAGGVTLGYLTVLQNARSRAYSAAYDAAYT
jgi:hypothetical protein